MFQSPPHILVTGATCGIEAAVIKALTERGAKVIGHGVKPAPGVLAADLSTPGATGLWAGSSIRPAWAGTSSWPTDIPLGRVAKPEEAAPVAACTALEAPAPMTGGAPDVNGASFVR